MALSFICPDFPDRGTIPKTYTRLGDNVSPPLQWSPAPDGARSFALVVEDPDAPGGTFRHWAMYDIPPDKTGLGKGEAGETRLPQAHNDFGDEGYDGHEPPGGAAHHYHFRLMALDVPSLEVPPNEAVTLSERRRA